jgi:glycosyltransferase involved in cell wall biosynthesis
MVPIKRLDRLVRAFSFVAAQHPESGLYFVGDGPERASVLELVNARHLADKVTFVGWSTDTHYWYRAADLVALTSAREGTPLALIEAAAAARPVVATRVGGVPDVVEDGLTGRIVDGDEDEFGRVMSEMLANPEKRREMGNAALVRSARYSASRLADNLDRLYRRLLERAA